MKNLVVVFCCHRPRDTVAVFLHLIKVLVCLTELAVVDLALFLVVLKLLKAFRA